MSQLDVFFAWIVSEAVGVSYRLQNDDEVRLVKPPRCQSCLEDQYNTTVLFAKEVMFMGDKQFFLCSTHVQLERKRHARNIWQHALRLAMACGLTEIEMERAIADLPLPQAWNAEEQVRRQYRAKKAKEEPNASPK